MQSINGASRNPGAACGGSGEMTPTFNKQSRRIHGMTSYEIRNKSHENQKQHLFSGARHRTLLDGRRIRQLLILPRRCYDVSRNEESVHVLCCHFAYAAEMELVLWICLRPLHANVRMLVIC